MTTNVVFFDELRQRRRMENPQLAGIPALGRSIPRSRFALHFAWRTSTGMRPELGLGPMAKARSNRPLGEPTSRRFGPYELVRRLGVGGMAEAYEAVRRGPGDFEQRVCLKLVQPFFRDKRDFLELFEREARLAGQLRHKNIVGVIDFGRIEGITYMALELVDGIDLAALMDRQPGGRVSHQQVVLVGHELAQALEHAHDPRREDGRDGVDKTIIHRDISPSNILVSASGEILLTDFGVAKAVAETARQQSAVKGKVPYMSPEQLRAEHLDGRADLFALGVVMFEALAGERPFQGEHDPSTIMKILRGDRPSLVSVAPGTPDEVCTVVESLLEVDRDSRPQSATALIERLDPLLPPSATRRELGAMASEARSRKLASLNDSDPLDLENVSALIGTIGASDQATPRTPFASNHAEKARRPLLWALLVAGAIGLLFTLLLLDRSEAGDPGPRSGSDVAGETAPATASDEEATAERVPEVPGAAALDDEVPDDTERAGKSASVVDPSVVDEVAKRAQAPAGLGVFVFPWGDVWIDGRRYGPAPLKRIQLEPGRYRISAGQGKPSQTRRVVLRGGERKTVQFDLTQ